MSRPFTKTFTATQADIDELGHVNNAMWVRWIQDMATAHWAAVALPEHVAAYIWVVTRHEIDYRGNVGPGESVTGRTWIESEPKGAQFDRRVDFVDAAGKVIVRANTTWAMIDRASGRLARVRPEIAAPFMGGINMIIVTGHVIANMENRVAIEAEGVAHCRRSRAEPGCIAHNCHWDAEDPDRLVFVEKWESAEALLAHFAVPASREFVAALTSLSDAAPIMNIYASEEISPPALASPRA